MDRILKIEDLKSAVNICDLLDEEQCCKIGRQVIDGYQIDENSRTAWLETMREAYKLLSTKPERKNTPWEDAANVKFPLIMQAVIDYASHTVPEIIQNDNLVKAVFSGADPDGAKFDKSERVAQFMSYQLAVKNPEWICSLDKLIHMFAVMGTCFKKIYWNPIDKKNMSDLCGADKVIINYGTKDLNSARRITHVLKMSQNDIVERQRRGIFCEYVDVKSLKDNTIHNDDDYEIELLEQHCFLDLDDDDYKEPYVVTVHKETAQVLRIVARFDSIEKRNDKIVKITPQQFFVDYHFIPSLDGGFYSLGFGALLLPMNNTINTVFNQLVDAGTLANMQGGFIGRGLRIKNGDFKFKLGEWKMLDAAAGTNIANNVFPMPVKDPSNVLFQLLNLLIQVGRDLAKTSDTSMGKQPVQNVSTAAASQMISQTTKTFVAVNERLFRSLRQEYTKLYNLNVKHLKQDEYLAVLNDPLADVKNDFVEGDLAIHPVADPQLSSEQQRTMRAMVLQGLRTANARAVDEYILQSLHIEKTIVDKVLAGPDPASQPNPEVEKMKVEMQLMQAQMQKMQADAQLEAQRIQLDHVEKLQNVKESDARIHEAVGRTWKMQHEAQMNEAKVHIQTAKVMAHNQLAQDSLVHTIDKDNAQLAIEAANAKISAASVANDAAKLNSGNNKKEDNKKEDDEGEE